jgi:hypothetical protein
MKNIPKCIYVGCNQEMTHICAYIWVCKNDHVYDISYNEYDPCLYPINKMAIEIKQLRAKLEDIRNLVNFTEN